MTEKKKDARYSIYLLYWYKSTNTDAEDAAGTAFFFVLVAILTAEPSFPLKGRIRSAFCASICTFVPVKQVN
jgi:hypothetical protein